MKISLLFRVICVAFYLVTFNFAQAKSQRLSIESPWFHLQEDQVNFYASYSGWNIENQVRFSHPEIANKTIDMIHQSKDLIVISVFLFDNFYAKQPSPWDLAGEMTEAIVRKKREYPDITVALILDSSNRAYSNRVAPAVQTLLESGVDVFYSDILTTKAHSPFPLNFMEGLHHTGRVLSQVTGGALGHAFKSVSNNVPVPFAGDLDGQRNNFQTAFSAGLIKANHRKVIIADSADDYEALVSSANPHNASIGSTNFALSVKGPLAKFIYDVTRSDIKQSIKLKSKDYVLWHKDADKNYKKSYLENTLPKIDRKNLDKGSASPIRAKFLTEIKIKKAIIKTLNDVQPEDNVRIQMFYLSDYKVIEAIMNAATRVKRPIRLLLDPNKDAFSRIKNGTPNRQVGAFLMNNLTKKELRILENYFPKYIQQGQLVDLNLVVRWFDTHGEQNHAKIMSVRNEKKGKYVLLSGSGNWTGKNLKDINMESNLLLEGAKKQNDQFDGLFDMFYANTKTENYSSDYSRAEFSSHAGIMKWLNGENLGFVTW